MNKVTGFASCWLHCATTSRICGTCASVPDVSATCYAAAGEEKRNVVLVRSGTFCDCQAMRGCSGTHTDARLGSACTSAVPAGNEPVVDAVGNPSACSLLVRILAQHSSTRSGSPDSHVGLTQMGPLLEESLLVAIFTTSLAKTTISSWHIPT